MASKCASKTLFVGNLHASLEETDLLEIFRPFGRIVECCKRWCHYGFIQFATEDEAKLAFNNLNGSRVRGRPMRIEFQRKKIRNLAALLEAEAQAKSKTNGGFINDEHENPLSLDDSENISPAISLSFAQLFNSTQPKQQQQQQTQRVSTDNQHKQLFLLNNSNSNDNLFKLKSVNTDENVKYSTFENDLLKQLSFLDSDNSNNTSSSTLIKQNTSTSSSSSLFGRKITNSANINLLTSTTSVSTTTTTTTTNSLPLATRNLNVSTSNSNKNNLVESNLRNENNCTFAKEIATNILTKSTSSSIEQNKTKKEEINEIDAQSKAWINYLLDKASKYSSTTTKQTTFSLSSSPLSPTNQREHSPNHYFSLKSQNSNSIETSLSSNSIILYRSLNTSNTIFVQPTDILEPLEIGEFNEYKLFPTKTTSQALTMSSPNKIDNDYTKEIELLVELTPPSSVSLSTSSSSSSSRSSSRSSSTSSSSSSSFRRSLNYRKK